MVSVCVSTGSVLVTSTFNFTFRYFDQVELDEIDAQICDIERNIMETVCHTPEGCNSLTWPLGVPSPFKPSSRHEVVRWDYFNETHLFLPNDFEVISELTGKTLG